MGASAALLTAALVTVAVLLVVPGRAGLRGGVRVVGATRESRRAAWSPQALHLVAAAGAAVAVLLVVPGAAGAGMAVAAGLVVGWRSRQWEGRAARDRRAVLESELPHVVDLMAAALGAGAAPTTALSLVAEVVDEAMRDELRLWTARLGLGADPVTVWTAMAGHPQLGRLGVTLQRAAESGAPVADALLRLAEELRERRRATVEERVRQVEVRAAVPLGVCLLPAFVLVGVVPLVAGSVAGLVAVR